MARAVQFDQGMGYQFVTCPETDRLELIETDTTPLGTLIVDCSGLHTACPGDCPRSCAPMIDRGDHELLPRDAEDPASRDDGASAAPAVVR
jgi:hypothetical protein